MITLATVVEMGLATVQDGGRPGLADVGVPRSGAWHRRRYLDATRLLRGQPDTTVPAIEVLAGRLTLHWAAETTVAVVGSARLHLDGSPAPVGVSLRVGQSARSVIEHIGPGPVYVVIDGWDVPRVLGSAATDTFSGISAIELRPGVELAGAARQESDAGVFLRGGSGHHGPLRVVVHGVGKDDLGWLEGPWTVSTTARSGTRLSGGSLREHGSRPSMPVVVGALQATPAGELIILGPDGGLTGGYPVVGVVCSADLPRVSELQPGEEVGLKSLDVLAAVQAFDSAERDRRVVHPGVLGEHGSRQGRT